MNIIVYLLGALALASIWLMFKYNKLVHLKALLDEAWSGIDVQLKRRSDLIPNLVETVKGYSTHEKSVFENVAKFRSAAINSRNIEEKIKFIKENLGKEISVSDIFENGQLIDFRGLTKGKGFSGPVKRFGISLKSHKSEKGRRTTTTALVECARQALRRTNQQVQAQALC